MNLLLIMEPFYSPLSNLLNYITLIGFLLRESPVSISLSKTICYNIKYNKLIMEGGIFLAAHLFIHSFLCGKKGCRCGHIRAETVRPGSSPSAYPTVLAASSAESHLFLAFLESAPLRVGISYPVPPEMNIPTGK